MSDEQDPAALVARAKEWVAQSRFEWANFGPLGVMPPEHASLIARLTVALEAALAREGRLRAAVEAFVWYDSNPDDEGITMMTDYAKALELARAALAADAKEEDAG